jgi:hypothetical protein
VVVKLLPHAGALPVAQPPPGDRAATAELASGQQPPGDAGAQLVDDAGQAGAVVDAGSAAVVAWGGGSRGWIACPSCSGTRVSAVMVMAVDRALTIASNKNRPRVGNKL